MTLWRSLTTALVNLRANKLRSMLTMLGVIIGVSAVIVMVSIVEGARSMVVQEFERLGSKLIIIGYQPDFKEAKQRARTVESLVMDDVRAIEQECDLIQGLSAEFGGPGGGGNQQQARYLDRQSSVSPNGVQPDYLRLRNIELAQGRFITKQDEEEWAKVCVIGSTINKELFAGEDPMGKRIDIGDISMLVVGVLKAKGRSGGQDEDKVILAPITTIQKRFAGSEAVGVIFAQPKDNSMVDAAMQQIWECLMRRHDNAPGYRVDSQENILRAIGRILSIFGLVLGGVAGLALLVGGIGVMNIMLVSVTERTKEIGLRKAVGAKRKDILIQFLIESATVTGVGGLIGIGLGAGTANAAAFISKQVMPSTVNNGQGVPIHLPLWAVLGAFAFSAFIGLFFGIYPAVRASKLDPIAALRHE